MRLTKSIEVRDFLRAVELARGDVYLKSMHGDCYNMKSVLSRYVALGALLGEHGDELELFCEDGNDEKYFFQFFADHPEVL